MSVVAQRHGMGPPEAGRGGREAAEGRQFTKLPELTPVKEEDEDHTPSPHPPSPHPPPLHTPPPSPFNSLSQLTLPSVVPEQHREISTESVIEALGLAGADEATLSTLLKAVRGEVQSALEELQTITTHDDNLERQYKETVAENIQLHVALEKARREIRHLKGQLSILQMTSSEIREERARHQLREKRRRDQERHIHLQRLKNLSMEDTVLSATERARTVNAKGEYVDNRQTVKKPTNLKHTRGSTYPISPHTSPHPPPLGPKSEPLPPPLSGCNCSICNARQSLGAITIGPQQTKSGQQILLGDRVIVKGERLGTVRYIGKLDCSILDLIYIGLHLDLPVGTCDGSLKGRRYFQCPPNHGVFVRPSDIICVTGRKPRSGGTAVPRVRERLPTGLDIRKSTPEDKGQPSFPTSPTPQSTRTSSTMTHARHTLESELAMLKDRDPSELVDESVAQMSERMKVLSNKSKQTRPMKPKTPPTSQEKPKWEATPTELDLPPRPPAPEPPSPQTPPPEVRSPTPLETTLLWLLGNKDLGNTGFVTVRELASALMQPEHGNALTPSEVEQLFSQLGIEPVEGVGIPYHQIMPQLVQAIGNMKTV